jgi:hypothetical protein
MAGNAAAAAGLTLADYAGVPRGVPEPGTLLLVAPVIGVLWRRRFHPIHKNQISCHL